MSSRAQQWTPAGQHHWLCVTCADRHIPTLAEIAHALTADERQRLKAEARAGDDLVRVVVSELMATGRRQA